MQQYDANCGEREDDKENLFKWPAALPSIGVICCNIRMQRRPLIRISGYLISINNEYKLIERIVQIPWRTSSGVARLFEVWALPSRNNFNLWNLRGNTWATGCTWATRAARISLVGQGWFIGCLSGWIVWWWRRHYRRTNYARPKLSWERHEIMKTIRSLPLILVSHLRERKGLSFTRAHPHHAGLGV
jgi:hypothetical protein